MNLKKIFIDLFKVLDFARTDTIYGKNIVRHW